MIDIFDLYYNKELEKTNEKLQTELKYRKNENIRLAEENNKLQRDINDLQSELAGATNDYKQATNEIKLLNKQIDRHITAVNDLTDIAETSHKVIDELKKENNNLRRNIEYLCDENVRLRHELNEVQNEIRLLNKQIDKLITENNQLKLRNKMLTKIVLNSIYGIHCCKNHCVYTDTDSI